MVYITNFEQFQAAALEMFSKEPCKTRFSSKYKFSDDKPKHVILKVTDCTTCIKYRTNSKNDLKYIDQFTQLFVTWSTVDVIENESSLPSDLIAAQKDPTFGHISNSRLNEKRNKNQNKKLGGKKK